MRSGGGGFKKREGEEICLTGFYKDAVEKMQKVDLSLKKNPLSNQVIAA